MKLEQRIKGICQKIYIILMDLVAKEKCQKCNETISNIEHISAQQKSRPKTICVVTYTWGARKDFQPKQFSYVTMPKNGSFCVCVCICVGNVMCDGVCVCGQHRAQLHVKKKPQIERK